MKPIVKNTFAFLGVILLVHAIYNFISTEMLTQKYYRNISKVKVGMRLNEARKIVGDLEYQYWTQDIESAEIIIQKDNGKPVYTLEYNMAFAGSDNPKIYFDPNTLIVTKVLTGRE